VELDNIVKLLNDVDDSYKHKYKNTIDFINKYK